MTATSAEPQVGEELVATAPTGAKGGGASWGARIALVLVCVLFTIPTIGLLVSSFRPREDIITSGWWTVLTGAEFTLNNYREVLDVGMGTSFANSLAVAVPATVIPILAAAFAAYAFAWMDFRGREILFVIFVGLLVVPLQVAFVPLTQLFNNLNINSDFLKLWLAHTGFGMPLAVYILRNYIGSLPREVIESAKVDGASHFETFWRLIIPLSVPALAAFSIFQFLWTWNDYLVALIFMTSGQEVVTITLAELVGSRGQDWHLLTAGAFISIIVPLIVFFGLQRFFVRGLTAGSVKG
ncbi:MAG: carbohydrate ABC transporter permease [Nitriliruptoraceae bacterium]